MIDLDKKNIHQISNSKMYSINDIIDRYIKLNNMYDDLIFKLNISKNKKIRILSKEERFSLWSIFDTFIYKSESETECLTTDILNEYLDKRKRSLMIDKLLDI